MSIKIKEGLAIGEGGFINTADFVALNNQLKQLLPGDYSVFVCDTKKNRSLSQGKYLFGVVLAMIGKETGETANDLYYFFERMFAPKKSITINGHEEIVQALKHLDSKEMGKCIEQIIDWAYANLGMTIPSKDELKDPMAQDIYVEAYNNTWERPK